MPVFPGDDLSSETAFLADLEASIDLPGDSILLLTKNDVPGSSLSGRNPA